MILPYHGLTVSSFLIRTQACVFFGAMMLQYVPRGICAEWSLLGKIKCANSRLCRFYPLLHLCLLRGINVLCERVTVFRHLLCFWWRHDSWEQKPIIVILQIVTYSHVGTVDGVGTWYDRCRWSYNYPTKYMKGMHEF